MAIKKKKKRRKIRYELHVNKIYEEFLPQSRKDFKEFRRRRDHLLETNGLDLDEPFHRFLHEGTPFEIASVTFVCLTFLQMITVVLNIYIETNFLSQLENNLAEVDKYIKQAELYRDYNFDSEKLNYVIHKVHDFKKYVSIPHLEEIKKSWQPPNKN